MRIVTGVAVLGAIGVILGPGQAAAKEAPSAQSAAKDAVVTTASPSGKVLYVCEDTAMTRRAFAREFGEVKFVTAEAAQADAQAWAAPKCITRVEARRLKAKRIAAAR